MLHEPTPLLPKDTSIPTPPTSEVASSLKLLKDAVPDQRLVLAIQCLVGLILKVDNLADDSTENQYALASIDALASPDHAQLTVRLAFLAAALYLAGPAVHYSCWAIAMQEFLDDTDLPAEVDTCYFLPLAFEAMARVAREASMTHLIDQANALAPDTAPSIEAAGFPRN